MPKVRSKHLQLLCLFAAVLVALVLLASLQGFDLAVFSAVDQQIFLQLRLPVVLTAVTVGASLAVSSAVLQVLLRNPLADPGMIGITSGASLFAAMVLLVGGTSGFILSHLQYTLPLFCFIGASLSTLLISEIARRIPGADSAVILTGIAISTLCGAMIAWMYLFSDAQSLRNLTFWLMGSLHQADWTILSVAIPVMLLLLVYLCMQGKPLNWFYFGANDARLAGLDVSRFNHKMLLCAAVLVGCAVSVAGSIAFVGLLVPHLLRNFFGHDNRFILPGAALVGATLMVAVVILSDAISGTQIPVSMITATLGGPVFLISLIRSRKPLA